MFQMIILLNTEPDQAMLEEGYRREIINRIQKLRKKVRFQKYILLTKLVKLTNVMKIAKKV